MDNNLSNDTNISAHDAVAMPGGSVEFGVASGIDIAFQNPEAVASLGFWEQLRYFYGEYAKGILFVLASTVFILAVPTLLTRQGMAKAMVGRVTKRTVDIVGSILGLILTAPLWLIISALIMVTSPGPVLYVQTRVGADRRRKNRRYCQKTGVNDRRSRERRRENCMGQPFKVIKFRTMIHDAEKECGPVWATKNDSRITRLGATLRKTRLDEIPQFINILKGDMSLVGPRPERPSFIRGLSGKIDSYTRRLEVRPGLTGLAQVESGYDSSLSSVADKVELDLKYIDNWSLWMDFKILCRTVIVVLTGRGAC